MKSDVKHLVGSRRSVKTIPILPNEHNIYRIQRHCTQKEPERVSVSALLIFVSKTNIRNRDKTFDRLIAENIESANNTTQESESYGTAEAFGLPRL